MAAAWQPEPMTMLAPLESELSQGSSNSRQPQLYRSRSMRSSLSSLTSLSSVGEPDLVRGAPLRVCLEKWGVHFALPKKEQQKAVPCTEDFALSYRTDQIDVFLSHDWKTSRASKLFALLLIFNSLPAFVVTVLTSLVASSLVLFDCLPGGWPTGSVLTYCAFYVTMCFWQQLRSICCKPVMIFLDRLCIAQHDDNLKQLGILNLAGILDKSQKLLILWSPRYFTRLWCAFELAHFLRGDEVIDSHTPATRSSRTSRRSLRSLEGREKTIELVPVAMALLLWSASLFLTLVLSIYQLSLHLRLEDIPPFSYVPDFAEVAFIWVFMAPAVLLVLPMQTYFGIQHMQELLKLREQLTSFSISLAECSCCAMDHLDPNTGEELICDKKLITKTLQRWYTARRQDGQQVKHHLELLNDVVRDELSLPVLKAVGRGVPPLRYVLTMILAPSVALWPQYVDSSRASTDRWWAEKPAAKWVLDYFKIPAYSLFIFFVLMVCWRACAAINRKWKVSICVLVPLSNLAGFILTVLYSGAYEASSAFTQNISSLAVIQVCLWTVLLVLYTVLYRPVECCHRKQTRVAPAPQVPSVPCDESPVMPFEE